MKKNLLISLILLQGCNMHYIQEVNPAAEPLVEPPDMRAMSASPDARIQKWQEMQNQLSQYQWQLVSYFTGENMQAALPDHLANIEFSDYKVSGNTGCNRYFASYQLKGEDSLTISQAGLTKKACPEYIAKQEQQYLKNLPAISFFQIQGDQLQLLDAQRQVRLEYKVLSALTFEKTVWQVIGINSGTGGIVSSANTGKANLQFIDGKMQGNSGCNALVASYLVNGNKLSISAVSSTRKICTENDLMTQEQQLLQVLIKVSSYEIHADQLRLVDADGSLMLSLKQQ